MRTAMSIDLRKMSSLLCWFIPSIIYFNILFLCNIVARKPYYFDSETLESYDLGEEGSKYQAIGNSLRIKNTGFTKEVNQKSSNSLIAFINGTVLIADPFQSGTRITSIQIGDGNSKSDKLDAETHENGLVVAYTEIHYCQSHPEAYATVVINIFRDRTIQFWIYWIDPLRVNCPITLKIAEGIYNGGEDGSGTITDEELIYNKSIPVPDSQDYTLLTLIPSFKCQAQTIEKKCIAESIRDVKCTWCPKTYTCVLDTSLCFLSDETEITQSQKIKPSNVMYIVVIVLACALIGSFIIGMFARRNCIASHQLSY
uniref:Egg protein CP111 n=1 Tax=Schistosoma japonicum TaxID=6182 RepID=C1LGA0_SCHJA|nr:Egg protein CP111 [Schistosoma japonicum]